MTPSVCLDYLRPDVVTFPYYFMGSAEEVLYSGGDTGDRTLDLKLAKLPLSHLSYIPINLVHDDGIEPPTLSV